MKKAIIVKPRPPVGSEIVATPPAHLEAEIGATDPFLSEMSMLFGTEGYLTIGELAEKYPEVHAAIGNIIGRVEGLPKLVLHAVAPPEGKKWSDIVQAVKEGRPFSLKVWVVGFPQSLEKAKKRTTLSYSIPVMIGEVTFEPSDRRIKVGDTEVTEYVGEFNPIGAYTRYVRYFELPIKGERRGAVLTEEEIEELREEFLGEEGEEISLEELEEKEKKAEWEEEEREMEELIEDAIGKIGGSKKLLKHVLLSKIAALLEEVKAPFLQKAKKKTAIKETTSKVLSGSSRRV